MWVTIWHVEVLCAVCGSTTKLSDRARHASSVAIWAKHTACFFFFLRFCVGGFLHCPHGRCGCSFFFSVPVEQLQVEGHAFGEQDRCIEKPSVVLWFSRGWRLDLFRRTNSKGTRYVPCTSRQYFDKMSVASKRSVTWPATLRTTSMSFSWAWVTRRASFAHLCDAQRLANLAGLHSDVPFHGLMMSALKDNMLETQG